MPDKGNGVGDEAGKSRQTLVCYGVVVRGVGRRKGEFTFSPYYVAGQLVAEGRAADLIPEPGAGLMTSSSPPFLDNFRRYFFPDATFGTGWIYLPGYAWLFRPLAGMAFPAAARVWLLINALLAAGAVALLAWARPWRGDPRCRLWRLAWIIFFGLTFQPVLDNMWHGNISGLILFAFCGSYLLLRRGA